MYAVLYRPVGENTPFGSWRDVGKQAAMFDTLAEACAYVVAANSKAHTPFYYWVA